MLLPLAVQYLIKIILLNKNYFLILGQIKKVLVSCLDPSKKGGGRVVLLLLFFISL